MKSPRRLILVTALVAALLSSARADYAVWPLGELFERSEIVARVRVVAQQDRRDYIDGLTKASHEGGGSVATVKVLNCYSKKTTLKYLDLIHSESACDEALENGSEFIVFIKKVPGLKKESRVLYKGVNWGDARKRIFPNSPRFHRFLQRLNEIVQNPRQDVHRFDHEDL